MKLSIIIPVYNERATLAELLRQVRAIPVDKELVVVDDGSTDGSRELLSELAEPGDTVLLHEGNRGKGAAVRTGLEAATGDAVVVQDADLEYDPRDLPRMLALIERGEAEVVYGSRFAGGIGTPQPRGGRMSLWGWLGNKFLTALTNLLLGTAISDMETCYKMFRSDVVRALELRAERFDFEAEVTAQLVSRGVQIREVPIAYRGRRAAEGKKIPYIREGLKALRILLGYRLRRALRRGH